MNENRPNSGISILICTYNGANRLAPTLEALINQKNADAIPWEIVLIDNASSDNTSEVAKEIMKVSKIPFSLINEPKPGRDNALRTGFESVKYEYVCNVDDDTWVCDDYVAKVWKIMPAHPEVAVCGGQGFGAFEVTPPQWLEKYETALAIGPQGEKEGYVDHSRSYLYGACAVYRKSLWEEIHTSGFSFFLSGRKGKKLNSGEDSELCLAWLMAGYKLWYNPEITFKHYMPADRLTWKYFRKLYKAFGRSDLIMQQYFKKLKVTNARRNYFLSNYYRSLLHVLYRVVMNYPTYVWALMFNNEGNNKILNTERDIALFNELFRNKKRFYAIREVLENTILKENI